MVQPGWVWRDGFYWDNWGHRYFRDGRPCGEGYGRGGYEGGYRGGYYGGRGDGWRDHDQRDHEWREHHEWHGRGGY